ncbi:hypothetical protein GCM10028833_41170 [Glycomyces tarimensis]
MRVDTLIGRAPAEVWHRVSAGPGIRGAREYNWAWATVPSYGDLPPGSVCNLPLTPSVPFEASHRLRLGWDPARGHHYSGERA